MRPQDVIPAELYFVFSERELMFMFAICRGLTFRDVTVFTAGL